MNKRLLRSYLVKNGDTQQKLAQEMGLSLSRLNAKLNETGGAAFTLPEMQYLVARYEMTVVDAGEVFFGQEVS